MKVKPMIFNVDMVRALLEGRKTQTRRPIAVSDGWSIDDPTICRITSQHPKKNKWGVIVRQSSIDDLCEVDIVPAPCNVGDLIYVRETFAWAHDDGEPVEPEQFLYAASDSWDGIQIPSIHMPRRASRLTLKVTGVRVERVRDISEQNALSEGINKWPHKVGFAYGYDGGWWAGHGSHSGAFGALWESIYSGSWNRNDWVWVIDFEVIRQNVDEYLAGLK